MWRMKGQQAYSVALEERPSMRRPSESDLQQSSGVQQPHRAFMKPCEKFSFVEF